MKSNPDSDHILYEDNHLLIVNKKAGQLSQGDKTGDRDIAAIYKPYLKEKYNKPGNVFLHPTHRLDRPVSGCIILARTSKALSRMTTSFREGKIKKHYLAISHRRAIDDKGILENYLAKNTHKNLVSVVGKHGGKHVLLEYEYLESASGQHLYHIKPQTGRSHQIRVQLAHVGCPILGDIKYGGRQWDHPKAIALHCYVLRFIHPTKKEELLVKCTPDNKVSYWYDFKGFDFL